MRAGRSTGPRAGVRACAAPRGPAGLGIVHRRPAGRARAREPGGGRGAPDPLARPSASTSQGTMAGHLCISTFPGEAGLPSAGISIEPGVGRGRCEEAQAHRDCRLARGIVHCWPWSGVTLHPKAMTLGREGCLSAAVRFPSRWSVSQAQSLRVYVSSLWSEGSEAACVEQRTRQEAATCPNHPQVLQGLSIGGDFNA